MSNKLEPETWLFQHEETGAICYEDSWQVENGFEENNPRWQKIAPMYRIPDGYKLVPINPTPEMLTAGLCTDIRYANHLEGIYRSMVDAVD